MDIDKIKEQIYNDLGINKDTVTTWLRSNYSIDSIASKKIFNYINNADKIIIIGDYDCDGICATHIVRSSINTIWEGEKDVLCKIPKRSDGYGINDKIIDEIIKEKTNKTLVITVDTGITAKEHVERLKDNGIKVIVTDHHELSDRMDLPHANIVIDPTLEYLANPFGVKGWCGAGIAYKIFEPYLIRYPDTLRECKCLAGLATIADSVPIREGNHQLVKHSLMLFNQGYAPKSLDFLTRMLKQDPRYIAEDAFGYYLGPAINAPGRLFNDGAMMVLDYLENPTEDKAHELIRINELRKELRDTEYEMTKQTIYAEGLENKRPMWVYVPNLHKGLVGIIAGKIAEEYKTPAIILTDSADGLYAGSARTYGEFNLFEYLQKRCEFLEKFGGHQSAAGLSITKENYEKVLSVKEDIVISVPKERSYAIKGNDIPALCSFVNNLRPFGESFREPLFTTDIELDRYSDYSYMGADKNHLSIKSEHPKFKITHFSHLPNDLSDQNRFNAIGKIHMSHFANRAVPELNVEEISDIDSEGYLLEQEMS